VFCPLYFFGCRYFCTNTHGVHCKIGAIFVKFSQLIPIKNIKIVAINCYILRLKCTKFNFGWGSAPDLAAGAYSALPDPLTGFNGLTSKGTGGERRKRKERVPLYFFSADLRPCKSDFDL